MHARGDLTRQEVLKHRIANAQHKDTGPSIGLVNESRARRWEALEPTCLQKGKKVREYTRDYTKPQEGHLCPPFMVPW